MGAGAYPNISTIGELLAYGGEIEVEAKERYDELADEMEAHNNPVLAKLFRTMSEIEQKHVDHLKKMAEGRKVPRINSSDFDWPDLESPETVPVGEGNYMMTEYEALARALDGEERAWAFYAGIAAATSDREIKDLAIQFADEERRHMILVQSWIDHLPPRSPQLDDLDDPIDQE